MKFSECKKELDIIENKLFHFIKKNLVYIIIGILIVVAIFYKVDFKETMQNLLKIPFWFIIILLLVDLIMNSLRIFRWKLIIQKISEIRYFTLFPIFFAGGLINQLTPGSKSGGQPLRAYYLSKLNKKDFADNLATVMFSFLSASLTSLALLILAIIYLSTRLQFKIYFIIIIALICSIVMVLVVFYLIYKIETKSKNAKKFLFLLYKIRVIKNRFKTFREFENNIFKETREFFKEMHIFFEDKWLVLRQMLIEFIAYLLEFTKIYLLFLILGIEVPFIMIGVISVIAELVGYFLFSPGGLGVVEGSTVGMYYLFGINPEVAAAVTLVNRALIYVYEFLMGYVSLLYLRRKQ